MKTSIKEVLTNCTGSWIITKVMQGYGGKVRIDAKRRFYKPDSQNFFSEWCSRKYADSIMMAEHGRKLGITEY